MINKLDTIEMKPLFILGCVRSGTTLVRDLLRRVPNTICPEETHYFRYGEPFGSSAFSRPFLKSETLIKHREIDGVPFAEFEKMLKIAKTRGELLRLHVAYMAQLRGLETYRWFDKTPQNVYGLPLLRAEFPDACFLHLVRNPLNVVASLKLGKVMKVAPIDAAINYWLEAVNIIRQMAPVLGPDLLEIKYEDFTADPITGMDKLLSFANFEADLGWYSAADTHVERDQFRTILNAEEQEYVVNRCATVAAEYGYDLHASIASS